MKIIAGFLLFLFYAFLAAPTVIGFVQKNCDTSVAYAMTEEESIKELKVMYFSETEWKPISFANTTSGKIISKNLSKHDNISASIFIPPPEQA